MEPLVFIITIMGCADDGSMCAAQRVEPVTYRTQAQCQAALPTVLQRSADLPYPTLQAACEGSSPRAAQARIDRQTRG